jgi:hypothetical protein
MNPEKILEYLMEIAEKMGIRIIRGKGDFVGGNCRIREDKVIVVNNLKPIEYQSRIIAEGLARYGLADHYIVPAVRTFIEEILNINLKEYQS